MNVHTPERQPKEAQGEYRARQAKSKAISRTMRRGPSQAPAFVGELSYSRFFLGQHTNKTKNDRRAGIKAMGGIRQFKRARAMAGNGDFFRPRALVD